MVVTISEFAGRGGVTADTLRYYERRGLLPNPRRGANGYRLYDEELIPRLRFIKSAQHVGLHLDDVKELLEILDGGACPCGHTMAVVERRLREVDSELRRLRTMRRQLAALGQRNEACTAVDQQEWWCSTSNCCEGGE